LTLSKEANVGIGTINPDAKLDVESSGAIYSGSPTMNISDLTGRGTLFLESVADQPTDFVFKNNGSGRAWLSTRGSGDDYDFRIYTNPGEVSYPEIMAMAIKQNGNIGIGTTSPDAKLAVNGKIHTKEVKVDLLGWSDFVFKNDYKLPTLKEVEKYIKTTGHLKDIPSEK
jgi:hypothetical protein